MAVAVDLAALTIQLTIELLALALGEPTVVRVPIHLFRKQSSASATSGGKGEVMSAETLSSERLDKLVSEIVDVVRRNVPDWRAPTESDPGVALLDVFAWLADALTFYQDRAASEAALQTRRRLGLIAHHVLSDAALTVTVDGARWRRVADWSKAGRDDRVYIVETGGGSMTAIRFGDGRTGARPPATGSEVAATYRAGAGQPGLIATVRWPPERRNIAVCVDAAQVAFELG